MKLARLLFAGWALNLKIMSRSNYTILITVFEPLIFSSIAYFMFRVGGRGETLLYAALGAGLMGIWSSTLFGSGGSIQWQRWEGTLEVLMAAPAPYLWVITPLTVATSTMGVYSVVATLLWGRLFFGVPLDLAHPLWFAVALPTTVLSLGLLGLLLASTFVLYRHANALSNLLEYPVWLVTGLLIPLSLLPGWTHPIARVLAPTWGVEAIRRSALGGDPAFPLLMTALLGAAYLVLGGLFLNYFEMLARKRATLSLT